MDAICERDRISKIQAYQCTQRHELYTAGCIASREIEMCEQEVVPSKNLRWPTPVIDVHDAMAAKEHADRAHAERSRATRRTTKRAGARRPRTVPHL